MCSKYIEYGIVHLAGMLLVQQKLSVWVNSPYFLYLLGQEGDEWGHFLALITVTKKLRQIYFYSITIDLD